MKTIEKKCKFCKKIFTALLKKHKIGKAKYCNLECYKKSPKKKKKKKLNSECYYCKKKIYRKPSKLKKTKNGLFFCSQDHKCLAQRISSGLKDAQPSHYKDGSSNYRSIAFSEHDKVCNNCGYNKHIEILQVHHKDRNKKNNLLNNLEILCPNCHSEDHYVQGDFHLKRSQKN